MARGLVLGCAVLLITAVAHTAGGHASPGLFAFIWLLPLTALLCTVAADRQRSFGWLVGYLIGVQMLMHLVLAANSAHGSHDASILPSASMALLHGAAALVTALVISYADAALHGWLRFLGSLVEDFRLTPCVPDVSSARPVPGSPSDRTARSLLGISPHRGPPRASAETTPLLPSL